MTALTDLISWFLEKDVKAKNAACMLFAICVTAGFFFWSDEQTFFDAVKQYGPMGVGVANLVVFVAAFMAALLVARPVERALKTKVNQKVSETIAKDRASKIEEELLHLTEWQRNFLMRAVHENREQYEEYELGSYTITWQADMDALTRKGIVRKHRGGVFEINREALVIVRKLMEEAEAANQANTPVIL